MAEPVFSGDYKKTDVYKNACPEEKNKWEKFRKENGIDSKEMYLILYRESVRSLPKEEKSKGNRSSETMLIGAMVFFLWTIAANQDKKVLLMACIFVFITTFFYLSEIFNPYTRTVRAINKQLKKNYPSFELFDR
jgi:hypothetical protein